MANYDELTAIEKIRFDFLWLSSFRIYDSLYFQVKRGTGEKELWKSELETLKWFFSAPGVRMWWRQQNFAFTPGFRESINTNVCEPAERDA